MIPQLTVSAVEQGTAEKRLAEVGPVAGYDFQPLLEDLLEDDRLRADARGGRLRIDCAALFDDETPSFALDRVMVGRLVTLEASLRIVVTPLRTAIDSDVSPARRPKSRVRVEFGLETHEDTDPDEISRLLALTPSSTVRVGERGPLLDRRSPTTRWKVSSGASETTEVDRQLERLLSLLEPRADLVNSLTTHRFDAVLSLVAYVPEASLEVMFTLDKLRLIRKLGAQVDVDLMVSHS